MSLTHARIEETSDFYYIFSEHNKYYAIKKNYYSIVGELKERIIK